MPASGSGPAAPAAGSTLGPTANVAEKFFAAGGLRHMLLDDSEQAVLLQAIAKHLRVLEQIPDFLPHLHVDAECCKEVGPAKIGSKHQAGG